MSGVYSRAGVSSLFGGSPVIQLVALSLRDRKRDRRQDVTDRSRNPAREGRSLDPLVRTRSLKQRDGGRVHSRSRLDQGVRTTATTSVGYVNCGMVGTAHPTSATSAQFRQSNWLVRATAGVPRHTPTRPWVEHGRERTEFPDRPCLNGRRIGDLQTLREEMTAWHTASNHKQRGVDGQFQIDAARLKLKSLYPKSLA